jgi:hypothetical protein
MTKTLLDALTTNDNLTENGMATNSTTLNACVDLFFVIGAMRGQDKNRLISTFTKAYGEDPLTAMRILFYNRDARGGQGERQTFKDIMVYLAEHKTTSFKKNINLITEYGRWDDLLSLIGTKLEADALKIISKGLKDGDGLCAKWMPRPNVKNREKKRAAKAIMKFMNMDPKTYRKMLAKNSDTVEQAMCSKEWGRIEYSKVPSKAMSDYMKAFKKNDESRFSMFIDSVEKGETKINAGAVYPYDITKAVSHGDARGANAQWNALPNFMEGNAERVMPMVDVSGSMTMYNIGEGTSRLTPMDVALSLGIYISERNEGPFKDAFMTFTRNPTVQYLKGSLSERLRQLKGDVGYDTNLQKAFKMLLDKANAGNVSVEEMPTMILVLSDMEFNSGGGFGWNPNAQEMVNKMYSDAGYPAPKLVWWNMQSRNGGNNPVKFDTDGTALVSGFSPSILKNLLAGKDMTPFSMMMDTIGSERYAPVTI